MQASYAPSANYKNAQTSTPSERRSAFCVGIFLVGMIMLIPVWDFITLYDDEVYEYLADITADWTADPITLFVLCGCTIVAYCLVMFVFFCVLSVEKRTEQTFMTMGYFFVSIMVVVFVLLSMPCMNFSRTLTREVHTNCGRGTFTQALKTQWDRLHALRTEPPCAQQLSVEDCNGFNHTKAFDTSATDVLKYMEFQYQCSGFCFDRVIMPSNTSLSSVPGNTASLQLETQLAYLNRRKAYPKPLFGPFDYRVSCDGSLAVSMEGSVGDAGKKLYWLALALIVVGILVTSLKLLGVCALNPYVPLVRKMPPGYDSA